VIRAPGPPWETITDFSVQSGGQTLSGEKTRYLAPNDHGLAFRIPESEVSALSWPCRSDRLYRFGALPSAGRNPRRKPSIEDHVRHAALVLHFIESPDVLWGDAITCNGTNSARQEFEGQLTARSSKRGDQAGAISRNANSRERAKAS
jgi:hypothetical protein